LNLIPKVLIAAPTSKRHSHLLDDWIKQLDSFTYKNFDVLLVDTTKETDYFKILKDKKVHKKPIKVLRMPWDPKDHILRHLARVRDKIRQEFLKGNYDNLFFLDTDIFIPQNSIQRLLSYFKDNVGFCVPIYNKINQKPCVLKSGEITFAKGLDIFSFEEINEYKKFVKKFKENKLTISEKNLVPFIIKDLTKPYLLKCYATGIGCLMIKRKVLEEVPFRTHPTFLMGEDYWYFNECNDKKFEFWCATEIIAIHKNLNWRMITEKNPEEIKFFLAQGPADATKAEFIEEVPYTETETKIFIIDKGHKNEM